MAHHKSAIKRIRQSKKRNYYNRTNKKAVKFAVRSVREAVSYEVAAENMKKATKVLDQVAARGIFHKNTVARKKSGLQKFVNKLRYAGETK